jgi:hypothetical protein
MTTNLSQDLVRMYMSQDLLVNKTVADITNFIQSIDRTNVPEDMMYDKLCEYLEINQEEESSYDFAISGVVDGLYGH